MNKKEYKQENKKIKKEYKNTKKNLKEQYKKEIIQIKNKFSQNKTIKYQKKNHVGWNYGYRKLRKRGLLTLLSSVDYPLPNIFASGHWDML